MLTVNDIFCKFGSVAEAAQLLETELGTLLLMENVTENDLLNNPDPTRAGSILTKIKMATLGRLINDSKSKISSVEQIADLLNLALKERNRLSHHFFREHNFRLRAESDKGRIIMYQDLDRMHDIILKAYAKVLLISGIDLEDPESLPVIPPSIKSSDHIKI